jgi:hypothetical protein
MAKRRATSSDRLAEFAARASSTPEDVYVHATRGWRYIPVHPFADDSTVLARIDWPSDRCRNVDAYWECDGDVHFVQVHTVSADVRDIGVYYRWEGADYAANLVAVLEERPIARATFESILTTFWECLASLGRERNLTPLTR